MFSTPTRNVALTPELASYIKAQGATGRYGSSSEVVRLLIARDEARLRETQHHG